MAQFITVDVVKIERELESEVKPEYGSELLQSQDKTSTDKKLLDVQSTPGEDNLKINEKTTVNLEYYVPLLQ